MCLSCFLPFLSHCYSMFIYRQFTQRKTYRVGHLWWKKRIRCEVQCNTMPSICSFLHTMLWYYDDLLWPDTIFYEWMIIYTIFLLHIIENPSMNMQCLITETNRSEISKMWLCLVLLHSITICDDKADFAQRFSLFSKSKSITVYFANVCT